MNALRNRSGDTVFLGYHSIAADGPPFVSITPDAFERQLAILQRMGFRSGTQDDLATLTAGGRLSDRVAFLTFDDGFVDTYTVARPLLEAYGFRALVFVIPPFVDSGAPLAWPRVERSLRSHPEIMRSMTWEMVEAMAADGHEIGSHTLSHPVLTELDDAALRHELADSREQIERRLGTCQSLAYPFGLWSPRVAEAAAEAGYSYGLTIPYGAQLDADALTVPRICIDHRDDERRFRLKLNPLYRALLLSRLRPAVRKLLRRTPAHKAAA